MPQKIPVKTARAYFNRFLWHAPEIKNFAQLWDKIRRISGCARIAASLQALNLHKAVHTYSANKRRLFKKSLMPLLLPCNSLSCLNTKYDLFLRYFTG
jgi:hypothetical protein